MRTGGFSDDRYSDWSISSHLKYMYFSDQYGPIAFDALCFSFVGAHPHCEILCKKYSAPKSMHH